MKILLLSVHFAPNLGGVETHLSDLVSALVKKKFKVFVLTYRPLVTKNKWKLYEKKERLEILRLPWIPGFFYRLSKQPVFQFLYLIPGLFFALPFILCFRDFEVIHAHGLIAGFAAVFWGKIFDKRVVISTHSLYEFPKKGIYRSFSAWVFRNADHVSTLSKQALKEIRSLGVKKNRSSNFTYWIDLKKFKPLKNAKQMVGWKDKFVVLFVGRLVPEKGIRELLESVKRWNKNITLAIIGAGPYEDDIKKLESKSENLQFLGRKEPSELPKYYSAADLLIVPSTHEEGFGRVIIEALACGTPVIGSNRGAIPEAMDESVGRLIDISANNIRVTAERFYRDDKEYKKITKNTESYAQKRYSEMNIRDIITAY